MTAVPVVSATLTTRTVREAKRPNADWVDITNAVKSYAEHRGLGPSYLTRERLTADPAFVVLDQAPDLTCRECWNGTGQQVTMIGSDDWTSEVCASCNGTGVSPVYAATWQTQRPWRVRYERIERRQVVEWRATDVTVLPVVKSAADAEAAPFIHLAAHSGYPTLVQTDDPLVWPTWMTDEPWAADLKVGQFVVRLAGWEHLDSPLTEQVLTWEKFDGVTDDGHMVNRRVVDVTRVPLSVPDGAVTWIELAETKEQP